MEIKFNSNLSRCYSMAGSAGLRSSTSMRQLTVASMILGVLSSLINRGIDRRQLRAGVDQATFYSISCGLLYEPEKDEGRAGH
jgi:hypothetical protein